MGSRGANSWRAPAPGPVPSPQAAGTLGRVTAPGLSFLTHKVRLLPAGVLGTEPGRCHPWPAPQTRWLPCDMTANTDQGAACRPESDRCPGPGGSWAGLWRSPISPNLPSSWPSWFPQAQLHPVKKHTFPTPKPASPGCGAGLENSDTFPQGQRDFSLPMIDLALPPPPPTVGRGGHKEAPTPGERNPKLQTELRAQPGPPGRLGTGSGWPVVAGVQHGSRQMGPGALSHASPPPPTTKTPAAQPGSWWAQAGPSPKCLICLITSLLSHNHTLSLGCPEIFPSPVHPSGN